MFNKGAGNQALVQYPDVASAQAAYEQVRRPTDKRTAARSLYLVVSRFDGERAG